MTSDLDTENVDDANVDETATETPELSLDVKVDEPSACERHVTVSVSRADIDRYFDEEFTKLMPEAQVPGFRSGRAPRKLVESHFKKQVSDQIKGKLLLDSMTQVSETQDFSAISEPDFDFDAVEIPDEGPLTFEFDIEVRPEFEMPKWKGLKLDRPKMEIGEKQIQAQLANYLEQFAVLEPVDEPAQLDDHLVVNISVAKDGAEISRGEEVTVPLRSNLSFPDGFLEKFDDLMVGVKSGDKKSAKGEVARQAEQEDLRGETVDIEFEVLDVKRLQPPRIDEALLKRVGHESEGDLKDAVKQGLERRERYLQNQSIRKQITNMLTESATWELPPDLLKRQAQRELDRSIMELRSSGFSDQEIQQYTNTLRQSSQDSTATALKEHFILERIAEDENLDAADEDYDQEIAMIALQSRDSIRSVRARIEKRGLWDVLRNQIIERKAIQLITENAKFKDVPHKPGGADSIAAVELTLGGKNKAEIPDAKHGGDEQALKQPADHT